jgi:hypothetical protein
MRIDLRHIIFWLPALLLVLLLFFWIALFQWNSGIQRETDALRRQLQLVFMEKPTLQAILADRNAQIGTGDSFTQQNLAYALMEKTLSASGLTNSVQRLQPDSRELELHVEEQLSLSLSQLDASQLAQFLYETQKAMPEMSVDSLNMRRNSNGFMDIEAIFVLRRPR